ncbi:unnamed protein product [marine sediment metagenome]|uniref:Transmembrane protein n=1 Tax=marine sediment metagenome TaxID=412755 RepID=X1PLH9_9ZZZZ
MDFTMPLPSSTAPPVDPVECERSLRRYLLHKRVELSAGGFDWKRLIGIGASCVAAGLFLLWCSNKGTRDGKAKTVEETKVDKQCFDMVGRPIPCDKGFDKDWRG